MSSKLPPMLRPVSTFITRIPDPGPPICLLNASMQLPSPPRNLKCRFKPPKAVRFPRSLLKSLKCVVRTDSPLDVSQRREEKVSNLRYPREKKRIDGPVVDLDKYVIENGKAHRVPDKKPEVESEEIVEETIDSYHGRINARPDLRPLHALKRENKELEKTLKELTKNIAGMERANDSRMDIRHEEKTQVENTAGKIVHMRCKTTVGPINLLDHNREVLYNVKSNSSIPHKDYLWQRGIRRSPQCIHKAKWLHEDPIILTRTVTSTNFKRLYLSTDESSQGNESMVVVRYPYCRTCITHSSPIRVRLNLK